MRSRLPLLALVFAAVLGCSGLATIGVHDARVDRVDRISRLGGAEALSRDPNSPTGYRDGVRQLIVPGDSTESVQWIMQTQQMAASGQARIRQVEYDNAPSGREIDTPSPYRWWLAAVASAQRFLDRGSFAVAVERAARWSDPVLHILLIVLVAGVGGRLFGWPAGATGGLAVALLYPFSALFAAAQPDEAGFAAIWAMLSLLVVMAGIDRPQRRAVNFFVAGGLSAVGWWISAEVQLTVVVGVIVGAILQRAMRSSTASPDSALPWRWWGLGGAIGVLAAVLIEYAPDHLLGWRWHTVQPLYGLAWLAVGHLLERFASPGLEKTAPRRRATLVGDLSSVIVVLVTVGLYVRDAGGAAVRPAARALTRLPDSVVAPNVFSAWSQHGFSLPLLAATTSVLLVILVGVRIWRERRSAPGTSLTIALGVTATAMVWACLRIDAWATAGIGWIALAMMLIGRWRSAPDWLTTGPGGRAAGVLAVAVPLALGALQLAQQVRADRAPGLTEREVTALINRDLAHWLARRTQGSTDIVLAPPALTSAFNYYGGLRGLGTPDRANPEGFAAAVRIAGATSQDEAHALIQRRQVGHLVLPSWDPFLDEYAKLGAKDPAQSLIALLHRWLPPRWLRPVAYPLPMIEGFEGQSVAVFEVVELQENATALSRLAEYFVEVGMLEQASAVTEALEQYFADDLGALIARAQVAAARQDSAAFGAVLRELLPRWERLGNAALPWDRRLALASVLTQARRTEAARETFRGCLADADERVLRSLSPAALFRFFALQRALGVSLAGWPWAVTVEQLLPPEARADATR